MIFVSILKLFLRKPQRQGCCKQGAGEGALALQVNPISTRGGQIMAITALRAAPPRFSDLATALKGICGV